MSDTNGDTNLCQYKTKSQLLPPTHGGLGSGNSAREGIACQGACVNLGTSQGPREK